MRADNLAIVFLLVSTISLQVTCTFMTSCKRGDVAIGEEIRNRVLVSLPDITSKYISIGDKIFAGLISKLPSSNVEPLVYLKPLLEQYFFPCVNTSKFLNNTLQMQSEHILLGLNRILNHKHLTCSRTTSLDEYFLAPLLSSSAITQRLDLDNIKELETPLNKILSAVHVLLKNLMGTLGETIMYKLPWLVKHAISDMMSNVSNIVMNLVTNVMLGVLITRSEVMVEVFGDCLQSFACYFTHARANLADPCEQLDLAIESVVTALRVDLFKSIECVEAKYNAIGDLKRIEDVMNVVIL